jgi:predicted phage-related endonuclease
VGGFEVNALERIATKKINDVIGQLHAVRREIKLHESIAKEYEEAIKKYLADHDTLKDKSGKVLATWKESKGAEGFDKKRFIDEHPILYKKYITIGEPIRKFLLKKLD